MTYLVTGAAGFIGFHAAKRLLERGEEVAGIDNLSDYYSPRLKEDRLAGLKRHPGFHFHKTDIADWEALRAALKPHRVRHVIHLAAQAGVRYSLENPRAYVASNVAGHLNILEYCRHLDSLEHLVYASSSSVYGGNGKIPFSEADRVDRPISLYAATKKSGELMSQVYSHLFGLPQTGLRFFTVYWPWGRPDMALWLFTEAILAGRRIKVFNHGDMRRDFTYVDDIVTGVLAVAERPPSGTQARHRLYNIGNSKPEELMHLIAVLERTLGRKAELEMLPLQPGDVKETCADISAIARDFGFSPTTDIETGIPRFVEWYRAYHKP